MNRTRTLYQRIIENGAIVYAYTLLLVSGIGFTTMQSNNIFNTLRETLSFSLDNRFFAISSFIGALAVVTLLFRRLPSFHNRIIYILSGLPVAIYAVLLVMYATITERFTIGTAIIPAIYFSFVIIAGAVYRPEKEV